MKSKQSSNKFLTFIALLVLIATLWSLSIVAKGYKNRDRAIN